MGYTASCGGRRARHIDLSDGRMHEHVLSPLLPPKLPQSPPIRALLIQPGNSRALVRRAQAYQELGSFRLSVEDLEAAEASVSAEMRHIRRQGEGTGGERAEARAEELAEIMKRLEHARWTKVRDGRRRLQPMGGSGSSDAVLGSSLRKKALFFSSSLRKARYVHIEGRACCVVAFVES